MPLRESGLLNALTNRLRLVLYHFDLARVEQKVLSGCTSQKLYDLYKKQREEEQQAWANVASGRKAKNNTAMKAKNQKAMKAKNKKAMKKKANTSAAAKAKQMNAGRR